jgi:hypothetical protein
VLFCVASGTDWNALASPAMVTAMVIKGTRRARGLYLTKEGRVALRTLMGEPSVMAALSGADFIVAPKLCPRRRDSAYSLILTKLSPACTCWCRTVRHRENRIGHSMSAPPRLARRGNPKGAYLQKSQLQNWVGAVNLLGFGG